MNVDQLRHSFHRDGYLAVPGILSRDEMDELHHAVARLEAMGAEPAADPAQFRFAAFGDDGGSRRLQQVGEPHALDDTWLDLARHGKLLPIVSALLDSDVSLYYSMFMMKPARHGFRAPWHQDLAFFVHDRDALIAAQVYLDDSTIDNGCIEVVPGSHRLGLLNHFRDGVFTEQVQGDLSAFDESKVAVPMTAGGVVLWSSLTLHSSGPNRSDRPRRAVVFEYKDPTTLLMGGAFDRAREITSVGVPLFEKDPTSLPASQLRTVNNQGGNHD